MDKTEVKRFCFAAIFNIGCSIVATLLYDALKVLLQALSQ